MTKEGKISGAVLTILIAEAVLRPDAAFAAFPVHRIHESEAARFVAYGTADGFIAQKTRWHARPEREDNKRNQVAHRHRPPPSLEQLRARWTTLNRSHSLSGLALIHTVAGGREKVEPNEEQDRSGDVDERVDAIDPCHEDGILQEEALDSGLVENAQRLFGVDDLQGMPAGDVDGAFDECKSCESASHLVDLIVKVSECIIYV